MTMDNDTPLRLNISFGEENIQLRKFFEEGVEGIEPVKVAIQTSIIRDPESGRWRSISTEVNYNQKLNLEARENEHDFYKQQIKDIEEIVSVADRAIFNITNDINTLKTQLQAQINQAVSYGCSFTAQPENREDYLAVKRYEGLDDYEGEPFSADLEEVMTETGQNGIGKGYRTVFEEDSTKGGLIGTAFVLRDPGGIMEDLEAGPSFQLDPVCDDFIAGIATFQPAIDALRVLINTAQIDLANQLKDKKTEAEVISWGYGNSSIEMKERIQSNVNILETLNANIGLFKTN
tara:strand:- start:455 stop:1327 length:873 start_codon:yes stop_codon:yes gene_type:complete